MAERGLYEGAQLGPYVLTRFVGQGDLGEVWKARHRKYAEKAYAVKVATTPEQEALLRRRARFHVPLSHPNIRAIQSVHPWHLPPFVAMDWVEGRSLREALDAEGRFSVRCAGAVLRQVLLGLEFAHDRDVLHRSLRPENVLLSSGGRVRVSEFGLARAADVTSVFRTPRGRLAKGPSVEKGLYLSPEHRRGERTDRRTDLYSAGMIFFEMLVSRMPLAGETPRKARPELPAWTDRVFLRATAPAAERFENAREFLMALPAVEVKGNTATVARRALVLANQGGASPMENHQAPGFETRAIFGASPAEAQAEPMEIEPMEVPPLSVVTRELPPCPPAPAAQAAPEPPPHPAVLSPVKAATPPTGAAVAPERPFVLPNGEAARTGRELLQLCFKYQHLAEGPLYDGQIEAWLADRGERGLYERSRRVRLYCNDRRAGLLEFLRGKRPLMLPDGRFLFSPEEFRLWAWKNPESGKDLLYGGQVIHWLDASGHRDLAERARKVVGTMSPGTRSLCAFLSERVYKTLFREPERLHVSAAPPCPDGMAFVPAGTLMMGLADEQVEELARRYPQWRPEWFESERPAHKAVVSAFFMDVCPVTNRQYMEFVRATGYPSPSHWQRREKTMETRVKKLLGEKTVTRIVGEELIIPRGIESHPVVNVSWHDALAYARWAGKRLPTEAEWERAGRGDDGRFWPWGNAFDDQRVNISSAGPGATTPVGRYREGVSPYGCFDLAGNVWEWCSDWFDRATYARSPEVDPAGPEWGSGRVVRGGCWASGALTVRTTHRSSNPAAYWDDRLGFRCAKSIE